MIETTKYLETAPSREFEKSLPGVQNHLERSVPGVRTPMRAIPPGSSKSPPREFRITSNDLPREFARPHERSLPGARGWLELSLPGVPGYAQNHALGTSGHRAMYIYIYVYTSENLKNLCRLCTSCAALPNDPSREFVALVNDPCREFASNLKRSVPGVKTTRTIHAGSCNYPSRERCLSLSFCSLE